jgi:hypothetical protein
MKIKYLLIALAMVVVVIGGVGCIGNKATGGGWFNDDCGAGKVIFGFTGQPTEELIDEAADWPPELPWPPENWQTIDAKGQFQLVALEGKTRIHGEFEGAFAYTEPDTNFYFYGTCSVNGEDGYNFWVTGVDDDKDGLGTGDEIAIGIGGDPSSVAGNIYLFAGTLQGGNITVHEATQ